MAATGAISTGVTATVYSTMPLPSCVAKAFEAPIMSDVVASEAATRAAKTVKPVRMICPKVLTARREGRSVAVHLPS